MKVATFNINNINRRLPNLLRWLKAAKPDAVALQELKASDAEFPLSAIEKAGYGAVWRGQKTWNGVAILARKAEPVLIRDRLPGDADDHEARYIEAAVNGVIVTSIYLPNGNPQPGPKFDYKLDWFKRLRTHAAKFLKQDVPVVLAGDYNVAPTEIDIYPTKSWDKDALIQPKSRAAFKIAGRARLDATPSANCIRSSASIHSGTTSETAGRAMPACGSIISCSARRLPRACSRPASTKRSAARKAPATTRRRGWC